MRLSGDNRPVLVIGYGNNLRRDDGAGLVSAEMLVTAWQGDGLPVMHISAHQLDPELADDIARSGADIIVFIDAAVVGEPDSAAIEMKQMVSSQDSPSLGHHLTPAAVMLYATELYSYQGNAWLITIPGFDFGHGEELSERCQALIDDFATRSAETWSRLQS